MKVVITVSKTFFSKHPKAGEETHFKQFVINGQGCRLCSGRNSAIICMDLNCNDPSIVKKIHTCRSNYEYWAKKISRLKEAGGVLSVRQWSGKPYRSSQEIVVDIPAEQVGVQKLTFERNAKYPAVIDVFVDGKYVNYLQLANNDGLSAEDFEAWFKGYNLSEPMAIIHFTEFRY